MDMLSGPSGIADAQGSPRQYRESPGQLLPVLINDSGNELHASLRGLPGDVPDFMGRGTAPQRHQWIEFNTDLRRG